MDTEDNLIVSLKETIDNLSKRIATSNQGERGSVFDMQRRALVSLRHTLQVALANYERDTYV